MTLCMTVCFCSFLSGSQSVELALCDFCAESWIFHFSSGYIIFNPAKYLYGLSNFSRSIPSENLYGGGGENVDF